MVRVRGMWLWVAVSLFLGAIQLARADNQAPRMELQELKAALGQGAVMVIDVRRGGDWDGSSEKIAGARREDPTRVDEWAGEYAKDKTLVLYCA